MKVPATHSDPPAWFSATVPKPGNRPDENEDAVAADPTRLRFALADGATEGWQSAGWAARVAGCFVRRPPAPADFPGWVTAVRKWSAPPVPDDAPWYSSVKREQGSFATLIGLELRKPATGLGLTWKAVAVGDSCLFLLRGERVVTTFPLSTVEEFGTRPALIPSAATACPEPEWLAGWVNPGDRLVLASDAVARHLIGLTAAEWKTIRPALEAGTPDALLEYLTARQTLLNDDATAVVVRVPGPPESPK